MGWIFQCLGHQSTFGNWPSPKILYHTTSAFLISSVHSYGLISPWLGKVIIIRLVFFIVNIPIVSDTPCLDAWTKTLQRTIWRFGESLHCHWSLFSLCTHDNAIQIYIPTHSLMLATKEENSNIAHGTRGTLCTYPGICIPVLNSKIRMTQLTASSSNRSKSCNVTYMYTMHAGTSVAFWQRYLSWLPALRSPCMFIWTTVVVLIYGSGDRLASLNYDGMISMKSTSIHLWLMILLLEGKESLERSWYVAANWIVFVVVSRV